MKEKNIKPKERNSFTPTPTCNNARKSKLVWGFTLAELLIVIIIIGILATIMYPRFETFRTKAKLKEIENIVEVIRAAEKVYYFKIGGYFTWTAAEAQSNYTRGAAPTDIQDALNITLPASDAQYGGTMCTYSVTDVGGDVVIQFTSDDPDSEDQGHYALDGANADTYDITTTYGGSKWNVYLSYLE